MKNIKQESGRSMVEMLGVLAIIGVLSIGGIAGYTMAMNRYRANEIIDTASKLSVVAQTSDVSGGGSYREPTYADIGLKAAPHGATLNVCSNGQVTAQGKTDGVNSALTSITGKNYTTGTGVIVVDGSGGTATKCAETAVGTAE